MSALSSYLKLMMQSMSSLSSYFLKLMMQSMSSLSSYFLKLMMQSMSMSMSMSNQQPEEEADPEAEKAVLVLAEAEERAGLVLPDDIPADIWFDNGKRLQSRLDVSSFRSVCRRWRISLSPPYRFPLEVPRPPGPSVIHPSFSHHISEVTFYAASNHIFVCEEEQRFGQFSASTLVPKNQVQFTKFKIEIPQISNLSFLSNGYHVHTFGERYYPPNANRNHPKSECVNNTDVLKVVIICSDGGATAINPNYPRLSHLKVVAHLTDWKLAVLSLSGGAMNNNWETGFCDITFDDIVNYRGQLYGVDNLGRVFVMDYHSLQMTQVASALPPNSEFAKLPPLPVWPYPGMPEAHSNRRKLMHLAVVSEDLYMFIHEPHNILTPRLYKLKLGGWLQADQDLPDQVFIQNLQCNFTVARDLIKYRVPRFCSWPEFVFVKVAGFNVSPSPYRGCDLPSSLLYFITSGN